MLTDQEKHELAEAAFQDFDFAPDTVASMNGWEWIQGGNVFERTVYLENPEGGDSIGHHFTVTINEDDNSVLAECGDDSGEWKIDVLQAHIGMPLNDQCRIALERAIQELKFAKPQGKHQDQADLDGAIELCQQALDRLSLSGQKGT